MTVRPCRCPLLSGVQSKSNAATRPAAPIACDLPAGHTPLPLPHPRVLTQLTALASLTITDSPFLSAPNAPADAHPVGEALAPLADRLTSLRIGHSGRMCVLRGETPAAVGGARGLYGAVARLAALLDLTLDCHPLFDGRDLAAVISGAQSYRSSPCGCLISPAPSMSVLPVLRCLSHVAAAVRSTRMYAQRAWSRRQHKSASAALDGRKQLHAAQPHMPGFSAAALAPGHWAPIPRRGAGLGADASPHDCDADARWQLHRGQRQCRAIDRALCQLYPAADTRGHDDGGRRRAGGASCAGRAAARLPRVPPLQQAPCDDPLWR
jgi:hypothetical protein